MILPDVNVLLYSINSAAPQQALAQAALTQAWTEDSLGLPWVVLLGFLRLSTRSGILPRPLHVEQALDVVHQWLDHPFTQVLHPGNNHAAFLARLLVGAGQGGPLVTDAHIAALAMEHHATVLTFDRDFDRFAGVRVRRLVSPV
jgi:uncharacterized protein